MMTEAKKNLLLLEIETFKKQLELIEEIKPTIRKFDGKVLSKRLDTALKKVNNRIRLEYSFNQIKILYYPEVNSIRENTYSLYITDHYSRELMSTSMIQSGNSHSINKDDNTVITNIFIEALNNSAEYIKNNIEEAKILIKDYDKLTSEKKEIELKIQEFNKKISWISDHYFKLRVNCH